MKATAVDDLYHEDQQRMLAMDRLVERLRDARARHRLGIAQVEDVDALFDEASAVIEEATIDVGLVACQAIDRAAWGEKRSAKRAHLPRKRTTSAQPTGEKA